MDSISYKDQLVAAFEESVHVKQHVIQEQMNVLGEILVTMKTAISAGNKIMFFGNGGSAADSQHIAAELVGKFNRVRRALPAIALTVDTSILTSVANDFGYEEIFARQIEALGVRGDVAFGISTSGLSPNVLKAMSTAQSKGISTVAFTGESGGDLAGVVDHCFRVPSINTARIQEAHITAAHVICDILEEEVG